MFIVINAETVKSGLPDNAVIIDVRTEPEYIEARLAQDHVFIPLSDLNAQTLEQSGIGRDSPVYMFCRAGVRARTAAHIMIQAGYTDVYVIEGGLMACYDAGIGLTAG